MQNDFPHCWVDIRFVAVVKCVKCDGWKTPMCWLEDGLVLAAEVYNTAAGILLGHVAFAASCSLWHF